MRAHFFPNRDVSIPRAGFNSQLAGKIFSGKEDQIFEAVRFWLTYSVALIPNSR